MNGDVLVHAGSSPHSRAPPIVGPPILSRAPIAGVHPVRRRRHHVCDMCSRSSTAPTPQGTQRRLARQAAQGVGEPPTTWWSCSASTLSWLSTYMQSPIGFVDTQARATAQAGFSICYSVVGVSLAVAARHDGFVSWSTGDVTIRPFVSVCCPMITAMLSLRLVHIAALTSTDPVDTATLSHAQHASSHVCSPRASAPASRTPHLHLTVDCAAAGPGCEVR
jgi:hypothetical protein